MNKKVYMTPTIEVNEMDYAPLLAGSITISGDSGITLADGDAVIPESIDAPVFQDGGFDLFEE